MYRIFDPETGLYYAGGNKWSKKGKVYTARNHLTSGLTWYAEVQLNKEMRAIERSIKEQHGYAFYSVEFDKVCASHTRYQHLLRIKNTPLLMRVEFVPHHWMIEELVSGNQTPVNETG